MNRIAFLLSSASLATAGSAVSSAAEVPGGAHLVERAADFDAAAFARVVGRPARIRQLVESVAFKPTMLNNVKNAFNGLQFGFGYPADSIAIALANHGPSAAYGYADAMWRKYRIGEFFSIADANGVPLTANVYYPAKVPYRPGDDPDDVHGMYQDTSIEMFQRRGAVVLACHTAIEEQSRAIVAKGFAPSGLQAQDVADDLLAHLVPGTVVVPSMVATVAVLQAVYHYTYLTLTL
ncbi:MAG TPA: hypothetical protein VIN40_08265 [Candidatus Tyrphobacter sp.]